MTSRRRGFTIIELMVVMGIIAVLATIVTAASTGAIKSTRIKRRDTMKLVLQQGLNTYYAVNGKWPDLIEELAKEGRDKVITGTSADRVFRQLVSESMKRTSPRYLDPRGLFVAPAGEADGGRGLNFDEAIRKNPPKNYRHIGVSQMAFGYQNPSNGKFRRFRIEFNSATESILVTYPGDDDRENY